MFLNMVKSNWILDQEITAMVVYKGHFWAFKGHGYTGHLREIKGFFRTLTEKINEISR